MAFPGNKVHRSNRRRLSAGQGPFPAPVTVTLSASGSTVIVTFSRPVNISGNLGMTVASLTFVSQVVNSPTQVTVTYSGAIATHLATFLNNDPAVSSYQGGPVLGTVNQF